MWRRSHVALACLAAGLALALGAVAALAANQVDTSNSRKIVITVPIDLIGGEDDVARQWNRAIKRFWNDGPGLGSFEYCGKTVELRPDIRPIAAGQAGRPDAHKIRMRLVPPGTYVISRVRWGSRDFDPDDTSTGTWRNTANDATIAHEFGHLLGLPDEYFYEDSNGNGRRDTNEPTHPLPEYRDGSLMAEHGGKVLQRHIDDAMSKNGVPCEQHWQGDMHLQSFRDYNPGEVVNVGPQTCSDSWDVKLTLLVDEEKDVSGEAVATLASGPSCTFEIPASGREASFAVQGRLRRDRFRLQLTLLSIQRPGDFAGFQVSLVGLSGGPGPPLVADLTAPDEASGDIALSGEIAGQPTMASGTLTLRCVEGC